MTRHDEKRRQLGRLAHRSLDGLVHLVDERADLRWRTVRVTSAVAGENPRLDRAGLRRLRRRETAMNRNHGVDIDAAARKLQRNQPAETVSDDGDPLRSLRLRAEDVEASLGASAQPLAIGAEFADARQDAVPTAHDRVAVHIARKRDIPKCGKPARLLFSMRVESGAAMDDQDAR
jgi:hypothetical protein